MTKKCWNCSHCTADIVGCWCDEREKPVDRFDSCKFWEASEDEDYEDEDWR